MAISSMKPAYLTLRQRGPFPNQIDPWVEDGHYFHQLHNDMLGHFARQIAPAIVPLGYTLGREASLQIAEGREPDIFIQRAMQIPAPLVPLRYEQAALAVNADPGVMLASDVRLNAIHIRQQQTLVTVIEVISPSNKMRPQAIADYRARRERLIERGVNIVEIDLTRSVKRLLMDQLAYEYPYHTVIFLPGQSPYFVGIEYGHLPGRIAIPLRSEVVPLELPNAYQEAYQLYSLAGQMRDDDHYTAERLPFPTLLSDAQREAALAAVAAWQAQLSALASGT